MLQYEDKIKEIDKVINSKRDFWRLNSLSYISFEDVAQIIRIHVHKKFDYWDQTRPIENWVSTVANSQIKNLIRNHYGRVAPPCNSCKMNLGGQDCSFTPSGKKCFECPLYNRWERSKKNAYELKLASNVEDSFTSRASQEFNMLESADSLHAIMMQVLTDKLKTAYQYLYIDGLSDDETAIKLGFKSSESRRPGYKQICNIKRKILDIAKEVVNNHDVIR